MSSHHHHHHRSPHAASSSPSTSPARFKHEHLPAHHSPLADADLDIEAGAPVTNHERMPTHERRMASAAEAAAHELDKRQRWNATTWSKAKELWRDLDVVGLVTLTAGSILFLLPFTLATKTPDSWAERASPFSLLPAHSTSSLSRSRTARPPAAEIWISIVVGFAILVFFGYYEARYAASPLLPPRLLENRTILSGSLVGFFHFISQFCYESFFTSFLQSVAPSPLASRLERADADVCLSPRRVARGHSPAEASYIRCAAPPPSSRPCPLGPLTDAAPTLPPSQPVVPLRRLRRRHHRRLARQAHEPVQVVRRARRPDPHGRRVAHDAVARPQVVDVRARHEPGRGRRRRRVHDDRRPDRVSGRRRAPGCVGSLSLSRSPPSSLSRQQLLTLVLALPADVAIATAIFLTITQVGGAVGGSIAGAVWSTALPSRLQRHLAVDDWDKIPQIIASLPYALSFDPGSATRLAIERSYVDVQKILNWLALAMLGPALVAMSCMKNLNLAKEDPGQGEGVVVLGRASFLGASLRRSLSLSLCCSEALRTRMLTRFALRAQQSRTT